MSILLRPQPLPLGAGIAVAFAFIALETAVVLWLQHLGTAHSFRALFLLGVLVVSAAWGFGLALATSLVSALLYFYFHLEQPNSITADDFFSLLVFVPIALAANVLGRQARLRATEAEERRQDADDAASLARSLAEQQTALRRVATLVARTVALPEIYPAAVFELSRGLRVENVVLIQYVKDEARVLASSRNEQGQSIMPEGERLSLTGDSVVARIRNEGRAARMDSYSDASGSTASRIRGLGLRSGAGAPILVGGRTWGALIAASSRAGPLPPGTELRIRDFADLVSTAIANAETRAQLTASRARIVAAGDQARQRFERDLHDGAQQHVVSLGLQLRLAQALVAPDQHELREQLSMVVAGLGDIAGELRELSHGMHPAILTRGGLGAAIKSLARRCAIPVSLDLDIDAMVQEQVEVAAYYVVAEGLTNAVKYAGASEASVRATTENGCLRLSVSDNGVGGALVGGGSGLIGLKDRVEALTGEFKVRSPRGVGTTLIVSIPLDAHESPPKDSECATKVPAVRSDAAESCVDSHGDEELWG